MQKLNGLCFAVLNCLEALLFSALVKAVFLKKDSDYGHIYYFFFLISFKCYFSYS